mmetsp:Transcript_17929/g.39753  ORF Transcript_17929/g.39753 Transcript_17929/m.39753 type:complete len:209 (-) Transcript_17929:803-1429(-)
MREDLTKVAIWSICACVCPFLRRSLRSTARNCSVDTGKGVAMPQPAMCASGRTHSSSSSSLSSLSSATSCTLTSISSCTLTAMASMVGEVNITVGRTFTPNSLDSFIEISVVAEEDRPVSSSVASPATSSPTCSATIADILERISDRLSFFGATLGAALVSVSGSRSSHWCSTLSSFFSNIVRQCERPILPEVVLGTDLALTRMTAER